MAVINKNYRIKHGLIVEGTTATVAGSNVLTETSTQFLEDTTALMFDTSHTGITFTYDDPSGKLSATVDSNPTFTDSIVFQGATSDSFETTLFVTDPTADHTITLPDSTGTVALTSDIPSSTDELSEGTTNKYYADSLVDSHLSGGDGITYSSGTISADLGTGLEITGGQIVVDRDTVDTWYDAAGSASTVAGNLTAHIGNTSTHGVTGDIVGTTDLQSLSNKIFTDAAVFGLTGSQIQGDVSEPGDLDVLAPNNLWLMSLSGNTIISTDPEFGNAYINSVTAGNQIATHGYVDNAISGLDWKNAVNLLATSDVNMTGSTGTLVIDGHAALDTNDVGYRILLINQDVDSENGIYTYTEATGTYTLVRTDDADEFGELIGAAVFVMEGTQYGQTSWVQSNHYITDFTAQDWTQFSGSGSVVAGTGITVDGLEVSIDRTTVDTWYDEVGAAATAETNANSYTDTAIENGNDQATPTYAGINLGWFEREIANYQSIADDTATAVISWPLSYGTGKFVIHIRNGSHSQASEVLIIRDSSNNLHMTEYAIVTTNGTLGDIDAVVNGSNIDLTVAPTYATGTEVVVKGSVLAWQD
jgi:hypothetical protein